MSSENNKYERLKAQYNEKIEKVNKLFEQVDDSLNTATREFEKLLEEVGRIDDEDEQEMALEIVTDGVNYYSYGTVEGTEFWQHSHC